MDTISKNPGFKRKVIIIWSAILLALHIAITLLSVYDAYISGDIMKIGMDRALAVIIPILGLLLVYIRYGVLVSAYHSYGFGTLPFTLTAAASLLLNAVSELIVHLSSGTAPGDLPAYLLSITTTFMIGLAVTFILLLLSRSKKERKRKATRLMIVACVLPLIISLIDEITFLCMFWKYDLGGQIIFTPAMIYPFINILIEALAGFVIIFFTHKILKRIGK